MPIQLDKILSDIAREKFLHPNYPDATKMDTDEAWERVSKSNKLSVHEARSIFKVLQKKYEQEKQKGKSAWKLFNIMEEIHRKVELKSTIKQEEDSDLPIEEDEEYEMLEVQEEDDHTTLPQNSTGSASASDSESPTKSNSSNGTLTEKEEKPIVVKTMTYGKQASTANNANTAITNAATHGEEKKLLNTLVSAASTGRTLQNTSSTVAALHKKGITLKKANTLTTKTIAAGTNTSQTKGITARIGGHLLDVGKTIQLPENIKRKLCEDQPSMTAKKIHITGQNTNASVVHSNAVSKTASPQTRSITPTTGQLVQVKQEREDSSGSAAAHGINLITIPANPTRAEIAQTVGTTGPTSSTAATVASTASTNGFSPRIEDIDFRNDIIFEAGNGLNGTAGANKTHGTNASDIINLGNFDNSLPPTFFKNLCNSSRHEALGLYVANVMNRLGTRSSARLELAILRAIIDVQSDELEH